MQAGSSLLRSTVFRFQYTHFEPFRHQGVTYLLTSPPDWAVDFDDTFVLFRPRAGARPEETCIFHQVQENF